MIDLEELTRTEMRVMGELRRAAKEANDIGALLEQAHCCNGSEPLVESVKRLVEERDSERRRANHAHCLFVEVGKELQCFIRDVRCALEAPSADDEFSFNARDRLVKSVSECLQSEKYLDELTDLIDSRYSRDFGEKPIDVVRRLLEVYELSPQSIQPGELTSHGQRCASDRPASPVASPAPVAQSAQQPAPGQRIRITYVGPANGSTLRIGDVITVMEQKVSTLDHDGLTWIQSKDDPWRIFGWCKWEPYEMGKVVPACGIPDWSTGKLGEPNQAGVAGQSREALQAKISRQRKELRNVNRRLREALLELKVLKSRGVVEQVYMPYVPDPDSMNWQQPDDS